MSSARYHLLGLAPCFGAHRDRQRLITLQMRRREVRCLKAAELLDALARYSE